ncbi:non-heme ferritin [Sulfuricurvum sp.]|uniref:non-heme ferritin n=1 Tax=Sulfuricurvum sp. TaxID=2025608 RepID=UPI0025D500B8|nr:non-heme ferritin [Sulfuricurvum sp.]
MLKLLNEQIALEDYSANLYLAMSSWCRHQKLSGSANFLECHSDDEHAHMRKLFTYVNETGAMARMSALAEPPCEFDSIKDVFEKTLQHEKLVTSKINALVEACLEEKDYSTFNFLQWYVAEQHEEEHLFRSILDLIDIVGLDGRGLYMVDKEIGKMSQKVA